MTQIETIREDYWEGYYLTDQIADDGDYVTYVWKDGIDEPITAFSGVGDAYAFIWRRIQEAH